MRAKGFDHTTQGAYAVAAGVSRALGLDARRTANAIAIAGTSLNALRVTRTGELSHWKGLAYPATAFAATHAAFLAMRGVTGPREVFEGNKGFIEAIAGPFEIDWSREDLESVRAHDPQALQRRDPLAVGDRGAARAARRARTDGRRGRADRAGHLPGRVRHHRRRRGGRQAPGAHPRRRPTTRCPTCSRSRCSTARCCPSSTCPSGSSPTTCSSCCAASTCAPTPSSRGASPISTALACAFACATDARSSASSTTTRASTPGR